MNITTTKTFKIDVEGTDDGALYFTASGAEVRFSNVSYGTAVVDITETEMTAEDLRETAALFIALADALEA